MNVKLEIIRFAAPVFLVGAVIVSLASPSLKDEGHFDYQPNPGALAKSPFGRTIGMALQGPIVKFWDVGTGGKVKKEEPLAKAGAPNEKLFNMISKLRDSKSEAGVPPELREEYEEFAMARVEKKLSLAWKMDPRNFANYAIYQMFLWEGFNEGLIESELKVRDLSLQTLDSSLADQGSPLSLLTAGQAAYDLVFAARTAKGQTPQETFKDIDKYSRMLPEILENYETMVAEMQSDGRWDKFSDVKKSEFTQRKAYLEHLNNETRTVVDQLTKSLVMEKGGRNS